jgi:hypothetical protein
LLFSPPIQRASASATTEASAARGQTILVTGSSSGERSVAEPAREPSKADRDRRLRRHFDRLDQAIGDHVDQLNLAA